MDCLRKGFIPSVTQHETWSVDRQASGVGRNITNTDAESEERLAWLVVFRRAVRLSGPRSHGFKTDRWYAYGC